MTKRGLRIERTRLRIDCIVPSSCDRVRSCTHPRSKLGELRLIGTPRGETVVAVVGHLVVADMETHKKGKSGVLTGREAPTCGATDAESDGSPLLVRKRKVPPNYSPDSDDVPVRRRRATPVEVVGGRTFPGELARKIIAGYMNPRVVPGNTSCDPVRRNYWCSRPQAAALFAKCVPRH